MLNEAATHVQNELNAAGVNATPLAGLLLLPGVWITPASIAWPTLARTTALVVLDLYLCASPGSPDQLAQLDELTDKVHAAGYRFRDAEAVSLTLPNNPAQTVPALRISTTITTEETP